MNQPKPRVKNAIPLDPTNKGKKEVALLAVCDAFQLPESQDITYINHHGMEVPGHIIFDGKRYRTSRVTTYDNLTDAAIALVRGD